MGALSVMEDGDNSNIIDSGNKLYLLKLNKKYDFDSALIEENFNYQRTVQTILKVFLIIDELHD